MKDTLLISGSRDGAEPIWNASRSALASWAFVVLGVVLRLTRYALNHPLWGDEAFLASNLIDRDFAELMRPLDFVQVCPILFLWIEKCLTLAFGFSTWSLRLLPMLASIASLILFRHVASRILLGPAMIIAVAVIAMGYYPIRHGGEIKPYATDFLVATVLITLVVEWLRRPDQTWWLWLLVVAGPISVAISHPAIFVASGLGVVLLMMAAKDRRLACVGPVLVFGFATSATFLLVLQGVTASQSDSVMDTMREYWDGGFPPYRPDRLILWLLRVHTSHMFAYPAGGDRGASTLTTVSVAIGVLALMRRGSLRLLAVLLAPFAMGLLAAFLGRYPYGGSARTMQYLAASICLLGGLGLAALLSRLRRFRVGLEIALPAMLALVGLGMLAWDFAHPYKSPHDRSSREFARRFWAGEPLEGEIVCARTDLGVPLDPKSWRNDRSALYLCHQAIYSKRHRQQRPPRLDRVSNSHPLVAVVFGERSGDVAAVATWLRSMEPAYQLRSRREIVVNPGLRSVTGFFEDRYVLYELIPASTTARLKDTSGTISRGMIR